MIARQGRTPEPDETTITLSAIRRRWWNDVAGQVAVWLIVVFGGPLAWFDLGSLWFWIGLLCTIGLLARALPILLARARLPVFAVRRDGIQLRAYQHLRSSGLARDQRRELGLLPWDRVGECHWLAHTDGLLVIPVVAANRMAKPSRLPPGSNSGSPSPIGRLSSRRSDPWENGPIALLGPVEQWSPIASGDRETALGHIAATGLA